MYVLNLVVAHSLLRLVATAQIVSPIKHHLFIISAQHDSVPENITSACVGCLVYHTQSEHFIFKSLSPVKVIILCVIRVLAKTCIFLCLSLDDISQSVLIAKNCNYL